MSNVSELDRILEEHKGILYKVSRAYGDASGTADDLAQEIAIQIWRSLPSFDPSLSKLSTWIYRIALNVAISYQRRERVRAHSPLGELLETAGKPWSPPEAEDELRMLHSWISNLDRPLDKPLILLYLEGESYRGIAEILGLTETNVATKLGRLKEEMRKDLNAK